MLSAMFDPAAHPPKLTTLAAVVARDSNLTFGGGTATTEVLRRTLVTRGWITDDHHRRLYALSRLTPGTNLLAYCTGIGWTTRGAPGAVVALLASSLPWAVASLGVRAAYERLAASPGFAVLVLVGMTIAIGLLASSAWHLAKPYVARATARRTLSLLLATALLVAVGMAPIYVLLVAGALGALWSRRT